MSPPGSANSAHFNQWVQRINEQSEGTLRIEVRDGTGALAHYGNVYDRVKDDVVQIGWALHPVVAGKFPLTEVAAVPFVTDEAELASLALWRLYKTGLLDAEYTEVVPLWLSTFGPSQVHFAKPQSRSFDDLRGLKVGITGRMQGQLVERMGGTPISVNPPDAYEMLQRGTVDGMVFSWAAFAPYKLAEVTAHHLEGPLGANTSMFFMSRKRYDALPVAARKAIDANSGEAASRAFGAFFYGQWSAQRAPILDSTKHKVVPLTAQQRALWEKNGAGPVMEEWAKSRQGGEKVLETYRALYAQAKAGR
jgi:TRAP-type C4-dicarboxylate transport system substrate-binding protein